MRTLPVLGVLVAGILVGVVGDRLLRTPSSPREPVAIGSEGGEAAAQALADLRSAVERLPKAMREELRDELAGSTQRRLAQPLESDVDRLTRAVEQLNSQLAKAPSAGTSAGRGRDAADPWKGPGYESLATMGANVLGVRERDPEWKQRSLAAMTAAHALWSRDDVIGRYGAPSRVTTEFGLCLHYDEPSFRMDEDELCGFVFITNEGIVTDVGFPCRNGI